MEIVDDDEQRGLVGRRREEGENPGGDQVTVVLAGARAPADRGFQRPPLRAWHLVHVVAHRTDELQQPGMVEERL